MLYNFKPPSPYGCRSRILYFTKQFFTQATRFLSLNEHQAPNTTHGLSLLASIFTKMSYPSTNMALLATNYQNITAVTTHQKSNNYLILTTPSTKTTMATTTSQTLTYDNKTNSYLTLTTQPTSTNKNHQVDIGIAQNKTTTTTTPQSKTNTPHASFKLFSHLPKDLALKIFDNLSPVESACLGLTCTSLYNLYMAIRGVVDLGEYGWAEINGTWTKQDLACFLKGWMRGQGFRFEEGMCVFVSEKVCENDL